MGTAAGMLIEARRSLGWGEPNPIHTWYGARNGSYFKQGSTPWCNMAITYWAARSGNHDTVCFGTDYAYTVWHAQRFQAAGRWRSGTAANVSRAEPGDIVFFDWGQSNNIGAIDHVGIVEKALDDGRVQTIEGNTGNRCLRRVRDASTIAGYGRPAYSAATQRQEQQEDDMPDYVSVGMNAPQDLPPNEWVTVTWGKEYSDQEHHHWDKGGSSFVVGPARYGFTANLRIDGLTPGTELQARAIEHPEAAGDVQGGPISEYLASEGATFVHYSLAADTVGKGYRTRFQVIHYGTQVARITGGSAKAFVWPTG